MLFMRANELTGTKMISGNNPKPSRRDFFIGAATVALTGTGALGQGANLQSPAILRNISGFSARAWQSYFSSLQNGAILVDTGSRALHFWSEDQATYRLHPTSIPQTEDLTRRGRTQIVRKVVGPEWRPTPSMLRRNPDWPRFIPAGPDNPLGTHALYLSWQYYRIHGTQDERKIGRRSSNGCIGLFNHNIAELYSLTKIGTQVLLI